MPIFNLHNHNEVVAVPAGAVIVLGYFDGVHLGHRALFAEAKRLAASFATDDAGVPVCVWTFDQLPKVTTNALTTTEERYSLFSECGIDYAIVESFENLKGFDGKEFFDICIASNHSPAAVVCGFNFNFGKGRAYGANELKKMAEEKGIACSVVPEYTENGQTVSSTRIRALIESGNIEEANRLLGSPYSITSVIEHGVKIGRKMGVRTINQRLPLSKVPPIHGVYCCTVTLYKDTSENTYGGICNIGSRPTVNDNKNDVTIETHIFDFDGEVYGKCATVKLYAMLREEKKFDDLDSLKEAIGKDLTKAKELLKNIL